MATAKKKPAGKTPARTRKTKPVPPPAVLYAKSRHPDGAHPAPATEPHAAGGHPGLGAGASN